MRAMVETRARQARLHLGIGLAAVILLAALVRLTGLTKEPFWLDEVCSFDFSAGSADQILQVNARDVHPPLYYLGLGGWRRVAGSSEGVLRGYSVLWSLVGLVATLLLGRDLARSWRVGLIAAALVAVNPVDVYYAQEARMYAQVAALATLGSWFLWRWMRATEEGRGLAVRTGWAVGFFAAATGAMYSHYLAVVLVVTQGAFALVRFLWLRQWRSVAGLTLGAAVSGLAYLPWLLFVTHVRHGLWSADHLGWMTAPGALDVSTLLFRELLCGGGHLPGSIGVFQDVFALVAVLGVAVGLSVGLLGHGRADGTAVRRGRAGATPLLFATWLTVVPVLLAVVASYLYHPVYFRQRFAVLVVTPLLLLVALAATSLPRRWARRVLLIGLGGVMASASAIQYSVQNKLGMRQLAAAWRTAGPPSFVVFLPAHHERVASYYLGAPIHSASRQEIQEALEGGREREIWVCTDTHVRQYLGKAEVEYRAWLLGLGKATEIGTLDGLEVVRVMAQPLQPSYPRYPLASRLAMGEASADPFLREGWYPPEGTYRWTEGDVSRIVFSLEEPRVSELTAKVFWAGERQRLTVELNGRTLGTVVCASGSPNALRFAIPSGVLQQQNVIVLRHPDAVRPSEVIDSRDTRRLAFGFVWLEIR
jgi:uncharacterized membrane protein